LAAWERATGAVSRRAGVRWISPGEMAQVASPAMPVMPMAGGAAPPAAQPPATVGGAPAKSPWHKVLDLAKSVTGAGDDTIQR